MTHPAVRLLETTPALYARLVEALVPGGTGDGDTGGRPRGGSERPAPANLAVTEHRHQLLRGLRWWQARAKHALTTLPHTLGPAEHVRTEDRPAAACAWLLHVLPLLPARWADELADNLAAWQGTARRLQSPPRVRTRIPLGSCPAEPDPELWQCHGTVVAAIPANRDDGVRLECDGCGRRPAPTELDGALDVVLPVHVVADLLGVSVRTVQRRTQDREDGLVRLGDALDLDTDPGP